MTISVWKKKFGKNLEKLMTEKGINQTDLSRKADISQPRIHDYLEGKCIPNGWRLVNIAKVLECSVDDLVDFGEMIVEFR